MYATKSILWQMNCESIQKTNSSNTISSGLEKIVPSLNTEIGSLDCIFVQLLKLYVFGLKFKSKSVTKAYYNLFVCFV